MEQQIAAFVLGVSAVIFVWEIVVAFRTARKVEQIKQDIQYQSDWISRNDEMVNRRIDQEIDRVNNLHTDSISFTNSRVDKLESKITDNKKILKG